MNWLPCPRSGRLSGFSTPILYIMYYTVQVWGALFCRISLDKRIERPLCQRVKLVEFSVCCYVKLKTMMFETAQRDFLL